MIDILYDLHKASGEAVDLSEEKEKERRAWKEETWRRRGRGQRLKYVTLYFKEQILLFEIQ
jgi:hypothetical protein